MADESLPYLQLFGYCTRRHRARLVYYDKSGRHQEAYVHMFPFGAGNAGVNVYHVTCPECGEAYATTDRGVETVES
jgi:hypothetical protein